MITVDMWIKFIPEWEDLLKTFLAYYNQDDKYK